MSISSRITSIEEHLKESYQELEGIGIDTTRVNNNLENIPKLLDGYWETLPKVTDEGTSITLDNTKEGKMKVLLKGNTYQDSTTGKNIFNTKEHFDYQATPTIISDNEIKITANGSTTRRGTVFYPLDQSGNKILVSNILNKVVRINSKMTSTTFSTNKPLYTISRGNGGVGTQDVAKSNTSEATIDYTFTDNNVTYPYLCFYFMHSDSGGSVVQGNETTFSNIIVTLDNSNMDFEPYTNGASPNPDYPQQVHTVSGDNTISVIGKNVLDFDAFLNYSNVAYTKNNGEYSITNIGSAVTNRYPLNLEPNTTYTLSCVEATNSTSALRIQIYEGSTYKYRIISNGSSEKSVTFTTDSSSSYYLNMTYTGTVAYPLLWKNVMLEKGENATTYQEYQGRQSYNVNLPIENVLDFDTILNYWGAVYTKENGTYTLTNRGEFYARPYTLDLEVGKTYTLSGVQVAQTSSNLRLEVLKDNNIVAIQRFSPETTVSGKTFTVEEGHTYKIRGNYSTGGYPMIISKPQLEEGTKANSFTPYGTTQIELCKIRDYQDRFIRTSGKNLYDRENATENRALNCGTGAEFGETGSITSDFIRTTKGDKFTITFSSQIMFYDSNKEYLGCLQSGGETIAKTTGNTWKYFTTPNVDEIYYVKIGTRANADGGVDKLNANIMLNKGYAVIPYEPYGNGDWYLEKKIGKWIFEGTNVTNVGELKGLYSGAKPIDKIQQYGVGLFFDRATYKLTREENTVYDNTSNVVAVGSSTDTLETLQAKFNGGSLYYVLAIPTYTKIEGTLESQLNALSGAKSYNSQTNISQENNDNASIMSAVALSE